MNGCGRSWWSGWGEFPQNHPSGSLKFSKADIALSARLVAAGELMDINVIDHLLITAEHGYKSSFFGKGKSPFKGFGREG